MEEARVVDQMVRDIQEADDRTLKKVFAALGVKSKAELTSLVKKDPEARRIFRKIVGLPNANEIKGEAPATEAPRKPKISF